MLTISSCSTHPPRGGLPPDSHNTPSADWIVGWMSAPSWRPAKPRPDESVAYSNQSVRQDVRLLAAADHIRLRLSNELGEAPVEIGHVQVARIGPQDALEAPIVVRFDGNENITLQPGEARLSDPVALQTPAFSDVAISAYYPTAVEPVAHRLMVRVATGPGMPGSELPKVRGPAVVSAVQVATRARQSPTVIVAFGDSITEGAGSRTPHGDWPSRLAERLEASCPGGFVVLNAGISGNHVLSDGGSPSALSRLDRDVLSVPHVSEVIFLEGINDIRQLDDSPASTSASATSATPASPAIPSGNHDTAQSILDGDRQIVTRLHGRGIKVIAGTLTPYAGTARQTPQGLASVGRINATIRDGKLFDGVIDFHGALDDPAHPGRMRPEFSSGDWLHPGDTGYAAMIQAIPLSLLGPCHRP